MYMVGGCVGGVRYIPLLYGSTVANNILMCINIYFSSAAAVHTTWVSGLVGGWVRKYRSNFSSHDNARFFMRMLQDTYLRTYVNSTHRSVISTTTKFDRMVRSRMGCT